MRRVPRLGFPRGTPGALNPQMPFEKCRARLSVASIDDPSITVVAHYNPSEIAVGKTLPWSTKNEQNDPKASTRSAQDSHEYKGTPARTMALELLFDGYEDGRSVEPIIDLLEVLSTVRDPESPNEELRRPHHCVVGVRRRHPAAPLHHQGAQGSLHDVRSRRYAAPRGW